MRTLISCASLVLALRGVLAAEAQQPATLTLACKGTTTEYRLQGATLEQPVSMGIIVNLADGTVQGFGFPFDSEPLKIGYVNDVEVRFGGERDFAVRSTINGSINRVTGDMDATWSFEKTGYLEPHMTYALQCKPAQRMF
jgi:hypothetical protein